MSQPDVCHDDPRILVKIAGWVADRGSIVLNAISVFLIAFMAGARSFSILWWVTLVGGVLTFLWASALEHSKAKKIIDYEGQIAESQLRERNASAALSDSIKQIATNLSKDLGLWSPDVRLTIYAHDDAKGEFVPLARVSDNPVFARKHRERYPDTQGYLAKAWENPRWAFSRKQLATVKSDSLASGYTEAEYEALSLKPRSLLGIRLEKEQERIGVALWESSLPERISSGDEKLDNVTNEDNLKDLFSIVYASSPLFIQLSDHFLNGHRRQA